LDRAVVGLGNPGPEYAATRHNVGFRAVERLARRLGAERWRGGRGARRAVAAVGDLEVVLAEPLGFMNRSGAPVRALLREYGLEPADCLVIHDDLDLELGRLQIKRGGGTAGHRGLDSIVEALGRSDFPRLRIGVGRPARGAEAVDYVLSPFEEAERAPLEAALARAEEAVLAWLEVGTEAAMGRVNVRRRALEPPEPGC